MRRVAGEDIVDRQSMNVNCRCSDSRVTKMSIVQFYMRRVASRRGRDDLTIFGVNCVTVSTVRYSEYKEWNDCIAVLLASIYIE